MRPSPLPPRADLLLALALCALWTLAVVARQWGQWADDLSAVYMAGWFWGQGQPGLIYAAPPAFFGGAAPAWMPALVSLGIADCTLFPYVYPPLWAVLTAPLAGALSPQQFFDLVTLIHVPMLAGSVLLAARLLRPARLPLSLWLAGGLASLVLLIPGEAALHFNQPSIATTFLTLLAFERLAAGHPLTAGTALALAAAMKILPALFVLLFIYDRQWRALAGFALTGAALAGTSLALAGVDLHHAFLSAASEATAHAFLSPNNMSLRPVLLTLAGAVGLIELDLNQRHLVLLRPAPLVDAVSRGALVAGLAITAWRLRHHPRCDRRALALIALGILVPLCSPIGWLHYYLLPMLLVPGLAAFLPPVRAAALLLVAAAVLSVPAFRGFASLPMPTPSYLWAGCAVWLVLFVAVLAAPPRATLPARQP